MAPFSSPWSRRFLYALIPSFLLLALAEGSVRLLSSQFRDTNAGYRPSRLLRYEPRPGYRRYRDGVLWESFNHLGFRGTQAIDPRKGKTFRLTVLGDSVAFGLGVRDEETFSARLEVLLNERRDGRRYEVINAAVPGYSPMQELYQFRDRVVPLGPKVVIWQLIEGDMADSLEYRPLSLPGYYLRTFALFRFMTWQFSDLYFRFVTFPRFQGVEPRAAPPSPEGRPAEGHPSPPLLDPGEFQWRLPSPVEARGWDVVGEILKKGRDLANANGVRLVVVFFPHGTYYIRKSLPATLGWLKDFTAREGIPFFDLTPHLAPHAGTRLFGPAAKPDYTHLSPRGHDLVVTLLADFLEKGGFLGDVRPP